MLQGGHDVVLADGKRGVARTSEFNAGQLSTRPSFTEVFSPSNPVRISAPERRNNQRWLGLARRQDRDRYEKVGIPLSIRSLALYKEFLAKEKAKVDLKEEVLDLRTTLREQALEAGGRLVEPNELSELGYKGFEGGWLYQEWSLHSRKLLEYLRSRTSELGAEVVAGRASLRRGGSTISRAEVNGKPFSADAYVVAAGSWSREVCRPLRYDPMVIPARGLVLFYRTGRKRVVDVPAHYEDEGVTATQHDGDTLRFTSFFELAGFEPRFSPSRREALYEAVTSHFSRPHKLDLSEVGVGFRPSTPDQLPVVGQIPGCENGYIISGSCRKGMALAPVLGKMLAEYMVGSVEVDDPMLRSLDPRRFEERLRKAPARLL